VVAQQIDTQRPGEGGPALCLGLVLAPERLQGRETQVDHRILVRRTAALCLIEPAERFLWPPGLDQAESDSVACTMATPSRCAASM
jgi:hypothetical protein